MINEGQGTGSLIIELSDQANQYVIADAVLLQFVGPTGQGLRAAEFAPGFVVPASAGLGQAQPSAGLDQPARVTPPALTAADLQPVVVTAKSLWQSTGLTAAEAAVWTPWRSKSPPCRATCSVGRPPTAANIWIDTDAASYGWHGEVEVRG